MSIINQIKNGVLKNTEVTFFVEDKPLEIMTTSTKKENYTALRVPVNLSKGEYKWYIANHMVPKYGLQVPGALLLKTDYPCECDSFTYIKVTDIYTRYMGDILYITNGFVPIIPHDRIDKIASQATIDDCLLTCALDGWCASHYEFKNGDNKGTRDSFIIVPGKVTTVLSAYILVYNGENVGLIISSIN